MFFLNYAWACPMVAKTMEATCWAMGQIAKQANCYPRIIQCDNGPEFQGEFERYCTVTIPNHFGNPHPCTMVHTRAHTPQMNAKVEMTNGLIRNRLRAGFVKHNNLEWVNHLADYMYNINHQIPTHPTSHQHAHNNVSPAELWRPGYHPPPAGYDPAEHGMVRHYSNTMTPDEIRDVNVARKTYLARQQTRTQDNHLLHVGDRVRLSSLAKYTEVKKRFKAGLENKLTSVKYLPDEFVVEDRRPNAEYNGAMLRFVRQNNLANYGTNWWDIEKPKYKIRNTRTGVLEPRWYYGSMLQKCYNPMTAPSVPTDNRAMQLNRMPTPAMRDIGTEKDYRYRQ